MTLPRPTSSSPAPTTGDDAGMLLVISGPSGVGKTTISHEVEHRLGARFSVSATTRPRAESEVEGRDYLFLDESEFRRRVEAGEFLEHAQVFGRHWYGTPREAVASQLAAGHLVILEIDVQGALQVRASMPGAFMIFIDPPSEVELLRRLRGRAREPEAVIQRRFEEAKREIELARTSGAYDHHVVNDALEPTIDAVCALVTEARRGARDR